MGVADNDFGAAATVPAELLQQFWGATYTTPQTSTNKVGYINLTGKVDLTPTGRSKASPTLGFLTRVPRTAIRRVRNLATIRLSYALEIAARRPTPERHAALQSLCARRCAG